METIYLGRGLELKHVPEYCAIIGGGIIGLEFTGAYSFQRRVYVIEALQLMLCPKSPRPPRDYSDQQRRRL